MHRRRFDSSASKWLAVATAVVPLTLVGCGSGQRTSQTTPTERVAGERQEDETPRLVREAGLPETFSFGGRTWTAHQIHWEETTDASATTTAKVKIGDYAPVADLMVKDHQIYRQEGADEAMTDNIFLRADNMPATAAGKDQATTEAGKQRLAFVEYDASGAMAEMALPTALSAAKLPQTITQAGQKWVAKEIQVYDADVFDEVAPMPEMVSGHKAYREEDDEKDTLFVMAEVPMTMPSTTTGPSNQPETTVPETTTGPIFIRYELSK